MFLEGLLMVADPLLSLWQTYRADPDPGVRLQARNDLLTATYASIFASVNRRFDRGGHGASNYGKTHEDHAHDILLDRVVQALDTYDPTCGTPLLAYLRYSIAKATSEAHRRGHRHSSGIMLEAEMPRVGGDDHGSDNPLAELHGRSDPEPERRAAAGELWAALRDRLSDREVSLLREMFCNDHSLVDAAFHLSISRFAAARMYRQIVAKLQNDPDLRRLIGA
jgi:hypothetical protein